MSADTAQAPDLHEALERAKAAGMAYVILDGKVFRLIAAVRRPRASKVT